MVAYPRDFRETLMKYMISILDNLVSLVGQGGGRGGRHTCRKKATTLTYKYDSLDLLIGE